MTEEEILDYNKRCAEFLEIPNLKDFLGDFWDVQNTGKQIYCLRTRYLRYDYDWNWIMEVYEKIKNLKVTAPMNGISDSITPYLNAKRPIVKALIDSDKEAVMNAINQFLTWYNELT